jgi:hypothetical protein
MFFSRAILKVGTTAIAVLALCGTAVNKAEARIFVGVGVPLFFPPFVAPPPVYYPPYYAPPYYPQGGGSFNYAPPSSAPQSLAPPGGYYGPGGYTSSGGYTPSMGGGSPEASAQSCRAGAYVCPLVADTPPGGACFCPGHDGQRIRGSAD